MRKTILLLSVIAALALVPAPAQAATAPASPTALLPWKHSVTVCLGKAKTRRAIKWLNRGEIAYAITGIGLAEVPGFWSKLLKLGASVDGIVAHRWARDTAKAYLHSGRRGAKVRVGLKDAVFASVPWWDAAKRDSSCR
jgi:hypothetical protein